MSLSRKIFAALFLITAQANANSCPRVLFATFASQRAGSLLEYHLKLNNLPVRSLEYRDKLTGRSEAKVFVVTVPDGTEKEVSDTLASIGQELSSEKRLSWKTVNLTPRKLSYKNTAGALKMVLGAVGSLSFLTLTAGWVEVAVNGLMPWETCVTYTGGTLLGALMFSRYAVRAGREMERGEMSEGAVQRRFASPLLRSNSQAGVIVISESDEAALQRALEAGGFVDLTDESYSRSIQRSRAASSTPRTEGLKEQSVLVGHL